MKTFVILEDNQQKVDLVVNRLKLERNHLLVFRNVAAAKAVVSAIPEEMGKITLILDGELEPGCGYGIDFLTWALAKFPQRIERVYTNSFSKRMNEEMAALCEKIGVDVKSCF